MSVLAALGVGRARTRGEAVGGKVGAAKAEIDVGVVKGDVHELQNDCARRRVGLAHHNGKPPVRQRPSMQE